MYRFLIFVFSVLSLTSFKAQNWSIDTLKASFKTRGHLDSLDVHSRSFSLPFVAFGFCEFPDENLILTNSQHLFVPNKNDRRIIFTALPHIGFGYSFGQQGTQLLTANYQQAVSKNLLLNANLSQDQFNGFQRNSFNKQLNYKLLMRLSFPKIESIMKIEHHGLTANWSDGLANDSLLSVLPQNLISVNKDNASSKNASTVYSNDLKYNFSRSSEIKTGTELSLNYSKFKRFYYEEGDLSTLYSLITIDSTETADSVFLDKFNAAFGFFYEKGKFKLSSHIGAYNWNSQTMGRQLDTTEINVDFELLYSTKNYRFSSQGYYGLYGNFSSFLIDNEFSLLLKSSRIRFYNELSSLPPSPFIRDFRGNNLDYSLTSISLQRNLKFGLEYAYSRSILWSQFGGEYWKSSNGYFFDSTHWTTQFPGMINALKLKLTGGVNTKRIISQLGYKFTSIPNEISYLPKHHFNVRIAYKFGLFKQGRLKTLIGVDAYYLSSHKRLIYSPVIGSFNLASLPQQDSYAGYYALGAFANFNVNQFRFFVRVDNLSYLWVSNKTEILKGYFYPSTQLKLGITWDFWN